MREAQRACEEEAIVRCELESESADIQRPRTVLYRDTALHYHASVSRPKIAEGEILGCARRTLE